jgi:hypothetical protein
LRALFNRQTVFAFLAGASLVGGIGAAAAAMAANGWHHGMMMHGTESPADMSAHVDHVLKHLYVEIDATDAQKAKIGPLVQQAASDLLPLHSPPSIAPLLKLLARLTFSWPIRHPNASCNFSVTSATCSRRPSAMR